MASGGKGGTQTTTQKTELPQYVQDAQQNLINQGPDHDRAVHANARLRQSWFQR